MTIGTKFKIILDLKNDNVMMKTHLRKIILENFEKFKKNYERPELTINFEEEEYK